MALFQGEASRREVQDEDVPIFGFTKCLGCRQEHGTAGRNGPSAGPIKRRSLGPGETRSIAELLIHCEEDRTLRAVLVGMLRDGER
jgi:hypothetical protein